MSKAQTDIRTTSYDVWAARPHGYQGDLDSVLAQVRSEPDTQHQDPRGRTELRMFLGVAAKHESVSNGPSVEMDASPRYGFEPSPRLPRYEDRNFIVPAGSDKVISKYSLEYALQQGWVTRVQS
jgi:hypothetical protein